MTAPESARTSPLSELLVVELGDRLGAGACGSLLAQLGAEVVLVEPVDINPARCDHKWRNRAMTAAGKRSVSADSGSSNIDVIEALLDRADIVVLSSDITANARKWKPSQIICDITAFGNDGPWSGLGYSDAQVQAVSGIADTTGDPAHPPIAVGFPILEYCAGIYAAAAIVTALRVRRLHGAGQRIDIALFDCAISALSTFLPFHMAGKPVTRAGNRHSLAAPWNAYLAADGWVLICTGTDDQWQRLCNVMGKPELVTSPHFKSNGERVAHHAEVDACVEQWTKTLPVLTCVEKLSAVDIPCGPIAAVTQLASEPNLLHRGMVHNLHDPLTGRDIAVPGSPLKAMRTPGRSPAHIPGINQDHAWAAAIAASSALSKSSPAKNTGAGQHQNSARPMAGVRVLEIGQYTTAPLVSRQFGAFGADVLKIEPPGGDGSRSWPPGQGDQGYFFTFSNSDKRSLMLDLRGHQGKAAFKQLLQSTDVLVENLKPGSLARLGFSAAELNALNPRLVYCSISGFGADSAYPQRPAFDTVVQAMSGFMDLTRCAGAPTKAGISAADIVGGVSSLLTIFAALEYRDRSGHGQHVDISMQDTAAWVTQAAWNDASAAVATTTVKCSDGHALIEGDETYVLRALAHSESAFNTGMSAALTMTRAAVAELAEKSGLIAASILTVSEAVGSAQAQARKVIVEGKSALGTMWPLLNSPLRLQDTPPRVEHAIGALGEANADVARVLAQQNDAA